MKSFGFAACFLLLSAAATAAQSNLERDFQNPPPEYRPSTLFHWMGGLISREGITKDLEAMASQGIGAVMLMQVPDQLAGTFQWPFRDYPGRTPCLSDKWFGAVNHAIGEAQRLGLDFNAFVCPGWSHLGGPWVKRDQSVKLMVGARKSLKGPARFVGEISRPPLANDKQRAVLPPWSADAEGWKKLRASWGDYYRDVAVFAYPANKGTRANPIAREELVDLTAKMEASGKLTWDVPAGEWIVVRLGLESHKSPNYPAPLEGAGLEADRMNAASARVVLENYIGRITREARAKGYTAFKGFESDSYESGNQDFSGDFQEQFQKRMGYECTPWLPAWHDKNLVIGNADLTARFRRDMYVVVSALWIDRFYGEIRRFADEQGLRWFIEPYFIANIDWRTVASRAHAPGSEIWMRYNDGPNDTLVRDLIGPAPDSAALYGQKTVWVEAFSSHSYSSAWRNDPWMFKPVADTAFCRGINHILMQGFIHNPFDDHLRPGFSFGSWGSQLGRHITWWPYSSAWHRYLARCQYLLGQGQPVADALAYPPRIESIPKQVLSCAPYKQTVCNDEALLERLSVKDGRIVLPHGVSYAALALPPKGPGAQRNVTPQALTRILELVREGVTLIGEPVAARSVSLQNHPACDREMARLVVELWGERPAARGERKVGQGRVIWGRPLTEALHEATGGPDFTFDSVAQFEKGAFDPTFDFFHRHTPEAEIYFVANLGDKPLKDSARFRVTDRHPQLWDAVTGQIRELPEHKDEQGHTVLPMRLEARQSVFVVFPARSAKSTARNKRNFPEARPVMELEGPWQVAFDPKWGGPKQIEFARLEDWTKRREPGIKYYSGTALYKRAFDLPQSTISNPGSPIYLDLGKVKNLARVRLNGQDLGIVWCAPWRVAAGGAIKEKDNQLEIEVVNTWVNRIIGDEQEPADAEWAMIDDPRWRSGGYLASVTGLALKDLPDWVIEGKPRPSKGRYTFVNWQFYTKDAPLPESGLLGPVRIVAARD